MAKQRRKDDERIATMLVLVTQVHDVMFDKGGNKGMKTRFDRFEGMFATWKWIAGGGGVTAIFLLIIQIIKYLK